MITQEQLEITQRVIKVVFGPKIEAKLDDGRLYIANWLLEKDNNEYVLIRTETVSNYPYSPDDVEYYVIAQKQYFPEILLELVGHLAREIASCDMECQAIDSQIKENEAYYE